MSIMKRGGLHRGGILNLTKSNKRQYDIASEANADKDKSIMRNLNPVPIALLLAGSILVIVGIKSGGGMGRIESIAGEFFMALGLIWIATTKFRS
jgi:uncharacterized membrane protein